MPEIRCTLEGCDNPIDDGVRIVQNEIVIGAICKECLGSAKGAKLFIRRDSDSEYFKLEEMQRIENPI